MVLKNSKYDKIAKLKYMKKHGIKKETRKDDGVKPKWSSKKKTDPNKNKIKLEDSDDEWDSDVDEALINHFYPTLKESEELTKEQKIKIKEQILKDLEKEEEDGSEPEKEEIEGIYLGTEPEAKPKEKFNLEEFVESLDLKPKKNRKMLSNKFSDNLLEEYGLDSYSTKKDNDYNDIYNSKQKKLVHLDTDQLDEFVIGEPVKDTTNIRTLTEDEIKQQEERNKKIKQESFYKDLKSKFTDKSQKKGKVLEIDNLKGQVFDYEKIKDDKNDFDLDEYLGLSKDETPDIGSLNINEKERATKKVESKNTDLDFLDNLLG
ncbi:unnamed protein product [Candida verbasci]|uniref:Uncharacterized protein n=1 Tax=Candida verbasci TaxID=1227364 RepID=A0A9W4TVU2_9ASCO|nr:unnamed protein product [Candida verbasci]